MRRSLLGISIILASSWTVMTGCDDDGGNNPPPANDGGKPDSGTPDIDSGPDANAGGPNISISFRPVDNTVSAGGAFFSGELTIQNDSNLRLDTTGWKIYFSFVRNILPDGKADDTHTQDLAVQGLKISRGDKAQSGDYFVMEPLSNFTPIAPGQSRKISLLAENWAIVNTDGPAGFHLVLGSTDTAWALKSSTVIDATDPKQTKRFPGDHVPVPTAQSRYQENTSLQGGTVNAATRLLPTPQSVTVGAGQYTLGGAIAVYASAGLDGEKAFLKAALGDVVSGAITDKADTANTAVRLVLDPAAPAGDESYSLAITPANGVEIRARKSAGIFYGIQTLRQLVPTDAYQAAATSGRTASFVLPEITISDKPLFAYRGMTLDVGRHFQTKDTVKKLLDLLAAHKINKFHFHITDDEGWRLEIPDIPELTSFGSNRGFDVNETNSLHAAMGSSNDLGPGDGISGKAASPTAANGGKPAVFQGFEKASLNFVGKGSGYYTTKDFEEILRYAAERHIDVIPEIDVPGHARAAVKAMEYRYRKYASSDVTKATQYRLADPDDKSTHRSVQGYTDNFVNPCLPSSYAFLTKVVKEVKARFDAVGAPLTMIHGGGDELPGLSDKVTWWKGSPLCQSNPDTKNLDDTGIKDYFFKKWQPIITATGAKMTGWDDIIHSGLVLPGFIPMPWSNVWDWGREDDAYKYANNDQTVILAHATNLYMDLAYNNDPEEPGYYWANFVDESKTFNYLPFNIFDIATQSRMGDTFPAGYWNNKVHLTDNSKRANILGMQGLLWGENLKSPELVEYFAFPKILGVAERAWNFNTPETANALPPAWKQFVTTLGQAELPRLDYYHPVDLRGELPKTTGVNYRVPLPGAKIDNGQLLANLRYPGLAIEYSTDNGTTFQPYTAPTAVTGTVWVRTKTPNGHYSRAAKVN
ncbi:carbohydate-binding domain-containing protein [Pendulispora brunnea]|uniref:beta-N-acetylhexosaminidase n=1 Tax=Pendulispora brunnea TaxID=2905690 RepID=A0ABZ2JUU8_9BACT